MNKNFAPSTAAALVAVLTLAVTGVGWAEGMDKMDKGMDDMSGGKTLSEEERNAFSQLDINKDGKISQEEAKKNANLAKQFDHADSNHDKALDAGEFARFETDTEHSK